VAAALLILGASARVEAAAYPDDVSLSGLGTWDGMPIQNPNISAEAYETVVRELGTAISNKPMAPAETLGIHGFDVSLSHTVAFISSKPTSDTPSAWARAAEDGSPTPALWIPQINVRKGLPLSLEVGANAGYVAFTRQSVFGAYGRWGLIEGYRKYPDVTMQLGYAAYVGNDELDLGTMDARIDIGYTVPFGNQVGINHATFSPHVGVAWLRIKADPLMPLADQEALGIASVSGFKSSDDYTEGFAPADIDLGFRIQTGDFQILLLGTAAPNSIATVNVGLGYVY
jgi:hypothetical protein